MKRKKRFITEREILDNMTALYGLLTLRGIRADELDAEADGLSLEACKCQNVQLCGTLAVRMRSARLQAKKLRKMCQSTETRLAKLGAKLAELQTPPLPGLLPDASVSRL